MLWTNSSSVIVGKNQNTFAEVNRTFLEENHIPVVRRMTGGGAVYHDLGNVNYSLILNERHPGSDSFSRFARPVVNALCTLGAAAEFSGRNDILVDGRKVSGSAQCCVGQRTLFHGTLLFDTDMSMLGQVLTPGKIKMESKGVKSVRSRVANLKEFLPCVSVEEFIEQLQKALSGFGGSPEPLPGEWCARAEQLADERYRQWSWNWGNPFENTWENAARFPDAGIVELKLKIRSGIIEEARITGDFFGDPQTVEEALKGVLFRRENIETALLKVNFEECFKGVKKEDFLSIINI
jgi:lipoate-protein ligase A